MDHKYCSNSELYTTAIYNKKKFLIVLPTGKYVFLFGSRFISVDDKKAMGGTRRENELLIQRRKEGGLTVP